jgi:glyoxylase-like metal-dependent hydrolase (beta-lactamase superfamily II)
MGKATPPATGGLEDGWYHVEPLDEQTFAIGEPRYHQQNWSYLLIGGHRSLLFDTGSYHGDITGVVRRRVHGSLTALPSHMHYDHLGNVTRFDHVALPDLPVLRACATGSLVTPGSQLFLGKSENRRPPAFKVTEWLAIGDSIDLGGRRLQILHTPGHSPDSVSLWEPERNRLLAADFLYFGGLYAHTPGASLAEYLSASRRLRALIRDDTAIFGAHGDDLPGEQPSPPRLTAADLAALVACLQALRGNPPALMPGETGKVDVSSRMHLLFSEQTMQTFTAD